jgi:hypothetical protein
MGNVNLIFKALTLDKEAIQQLSDPNSNWKLISAFITFLLGIFYGFTSITINNELIASFETPLLRETVVPGLFLFFGIVMIFITKIGFSLLLWAGARGFGGPGYLRILYRNTSIALIPSVMALPAFISWQVGAPLTFLMVLFLALSITWMYLIFAKILEVTQPLVPWKAYVAILLVFIFFTSVYYIVTPPAA